MIVSARTLLPLLAVLLSGPLAGCDLFGPRDPEPPIDEGSGFEVPTAPNILLDNLRRSITEANAIDYRRNFYIVIVKNLSQQKYSPLQCPLVKRVVEPVER